MDNDVKRFLLSALEILRDHQKEINKLHGSVRALYEYARERDPDSALDLGLKSSAYKKRESGGRSGETLQRLDELLRELKKVT